VHLPAAEVSRSPYPDLNDDLWKNPYDSEIDTHGLTPVVLKPKKSLQENLTLSPRVYAVVLSAGSDRGFYQ